VDSLSASCLNIEGYDLVSYSLHSKYGHATCVRPDLADMEPLPSNSDLCDIVRVGHFRVANVYKPPSQPWPTPNILSKLIYVGDFNSHHTTWGYRESDQNGVDLLDWASLHDLHLIHDPKQRGTFHSARWKQDYSPDLTWTTSTGNHPLQAISSVLKNFPHSQHRPILTKVGVTILIVSTNKNPRWNYRKANWPSFTQFTDRYVTCIPYNISIEEAYMQFTKATYKAATKSIPRGCYKIYISCLDEECAELLKQYEESGNPNIATHLLDSLNTSRRTRWERATVELNMSRSSCKAWALIRKLGHSAITQSPNSIATHLTNVAKADKDKKFEGEVKKKWRQYKQCIPETEEDLQPFTADEIERTIKTLKTGKACGLDNISPEFLKNLG
uniref:Endonuclease/exonuclease/phosphatase domain-containing protein n=1 Tax=Latimeria chalumnae TaxID=7897 RepID=H3AFP2_LATCH